MSRYRIVHWREIVGEESLPVFLKIEKAIIMAERIKAESPEKTVLSKVSAEDAAMWRKKRWQMRRCGIEKIGKMEIPLGWYKSYLDSEGNVKFMTTAPPEREIILLKDYMRLREDIMLEQYEEEYYFTREE